MICGHCKAADVDIPHVKVCGRTPGADNYLDAVGAPSWDSIVAGRALHPVTEAGMYRHDGTIYKVQAAVHGSGHLYAKRLVVTEGYDGSIVANFEFAQGVIRQLYAEDRLTIEDAKEFGALYGTCCVCGRTLTNETSIEAGIGPVCAGRL